MQNIHAERLYTLAQFLRTIPEEKLDMRIWTAHADNTDKRVLEPIYQDRVMCEPENRDIYSTCVREHNCGTAACALGWATTITEFNRDGLVIANYNPALVDWDTMNVIESDPFRAAAKFFGITLNDASNLFSNNEEFYGWNPDGDEDEDDYVITPVMVADKLEEILKIYHPNWSPPETTKKDDKIDFLSLTRDIVKGS
jgi:hypothetical protein